jgi:hypothetical protein
VKVNVDGWNGYTLFDMHNGFVIYYVQKQMRRDIEHAYNIDSKRAREIARVCGVGLNELKGAVASESEC